MSDPEEVPLVTLNDKSPYYKFLREREKFTPDETINYQTCEDYFHEDYFLNEKKIISNKIYDEEDKDEDADKDTMIIEYNNDIDLNRKIKIRKGATKNKDYTHIEETFNLLTSLKLPRAVSASEAETQEIKRDGGGNYLARGGAPLVRRISASINDARARQTRESADSDNFHLHRSFFLIIWEHFAPNFNIKKRPRTHDTRPLNVRLPPIYSIDGNRVCSVLLRCVTQGNNIAYSVLFEFTNFIHWSIFYSFKIDTPNSGQVSELHFTLNQYPPDIPKTRMFFEYTRYIDGQIQIAIDAEPDPTTGLSSNVQQARIMEIVSELMLLTMYQLATAMSYTTGLIFSDTALTMRQNIDSLGTFFHENQLLNIAERHADLIECIKDEFSSRSIDLSSTSIIFFDHLIRDIRNIQAGGNNINRYLTKINNIKEKLKLLKKNKVKNKVKITKLSKLIDELKAKLKKQKEKDKAKLKKQKEKEKAKLKKQKEKEKAKLKKQKEKNNVKRKKTKAKKS
jgi:hypothetical protein